MESFSANPSSSNLNPESRKSVWEGPISSKVLLAPSQPQLPQQLLKITATPPILVPDVPGSSEEASKRNSRKKARKRKSDLVSNSAHLEATKNPSQPHHQKVIPKVAHEKLVDFAQLLQSAEQSKSSKQKVKAQKVVVPLATKEAGASLAVVSSSRHGAEGAAGNSLDASAPSKLRGKERETPKPKNPSALRKLILHSRELRGKNEQNEIQGTLAEKSELVGSEEIQEVLEEEERWNAALPTFISSEKEPKLSAEELKDEFLEKLDRFRLSSMAPSIDSADIPEEQNVVEVKVESHSPATSASAPSDNQLHSRKFRDYCDHFVTQEINALTEKIMDTLAHYQDRSFHQQDPSKFKRRFVCGLKDVAKLQEARQATLIIVAPDMEDVEGAGGINDRLAEIRTTAAEQNVPVVFALKRYKLGKKCRKKVPVSVVAVLNQDVALADIKELMRHVEQARLDYASRIAELSGTCVS